MLAIAPVVAAYYVGLGVLALWGIACKDDEAPAPADTSTDSGTKTSTKADAGGADAGRIDAGPRECLPPADKARDSDGDGTADYCDCSYEFGRPSWNPGRINSDIDRQDNPIQDLDRFDDRAGRRIYGVVGSPVNHLFRVRSTGPHVDDLGAVGGPFRNEGLLQPFQLIPYGNRAYVPWMTGDRSTFGIDIVIGGQGVTKSFPQAGISHRVSSGATVITNQSNISGAGVVVDGARLLLGGEVQRAIDARGQVISPSGGQGSVMFFGLAEDGSLRTPSANDPVTYTSGRVVAMGELNKTTVLALSRGRSRGDEPTLDRIAIDNPTGSPRSTLRLGPGRVVQTFPELAVVTSTGAEAVYIGSTTSSAGVDRPSLLRVQLADNRIQEIPLPNRLAGGTIAGTTIFRSSRFGAIPAMTVRRSPSTDPYESRGWVAVAFPAGVVDNEIIWNFCIAEPGLEPKSIVATKHSDDGSPFDDGLLIGVSNLLYCEADPEDEGQGPGDDHRGVELLNVANWIADCK